MCVHNAGRSQMAEAYLNHFAKARGLNVVAESAGTQGGKGVNPLTAQVMEEEGISLEGHLPKVIDQPMVDRADKIITMGCGVNADTCPARFLVTEDWGLDDPAGQSIDKVRTIRDQVRERVLKLIEGER